MTNAYNELDFLTHISTKLYNNNNKDSIFNTMASHTYDVGSGEWSETDDEYRTLFKNSEVDDILEYYKENVYKNDADNDLNPYFKLLTAFETQNAMKFTAANFSFFISNRFGCLSYE